MRTHSLAVSDWLPLLHPLRVRAFSGFPKSQVPPLRTCVALVTGMTDEVFAAACITELLGHTSAYRDWVTLRELMDTQLADALESTNNMSLNDPMDWYAGPIFTSRSASAAFVVTSSAPCCPHLALK